MEYFPKEELENLRLQYFTNCLRKKYHIVSKLFLLHPDLLGKGPDCYPMLVWNKVVIEIFDFTPFILTPVTLLFRQQGPLCICDLLHKREQSLKAVSHVFILQAGFEVKIVQMWEQGFVAKA